MKEALLVVIVVAAIGVVLLAALSASKVSDDIDEWERRDGR